MAESIIVCPNCQQNIPLTNAIEGPIAERLRREFEAKSRAKEQAILELEKSVLAQRVELSKAKQAHEIEIQTRLADERHKLADEAKKKAEAAIAAQVADLRSQLTEQHRKLECAQATELELRKQRRELEQQKEALALEVTRRVDAECEKIKQETQKTVEADYQRKEKERQQQLEELRLKVAAGERRAEALAVKEQSLASEKARLQQLQESMDAQVVEKLNAERQKLLGEALQRATAQKAVELQDLQQRLAEKDSKLQAAQQLEIALRNERVKLEEQKRELELQNIRQLDEERAKIRDAALKAANETHLLREREAEEKMAAMRRQIDELKQRAEQGSQQLQGEVLELELEETLRSAYPHDEIIPVPKGVHGGDVLHRIMTPSRQHCGTILWETKRTKAWSDGWIDKLKADQRAAKADLAVIVSITLPRDCTTMKEINGVWVSSRDCMMGMVMALRSGLIRLAESRRAAQGQHQKMEVLYQYVSGHEFKQRVEAIIDAFTAMRKDLDDEKKAMTRIWAKREKQIDRVLDSTSGMHGDLAGIIGAALPVIEAIDLPALAEAESVE